MKLISFQQYSLYDAGGGSRILRRLYLGRENDVYSVGVKQNNSKTLIGTINEKIVTAHPVHKKWMRSFTRHFFTWVREKFFFKNALDKIRRNTEYLDADILHIVDHGKYSSAFTSNFKKKSKIWVSFHDHFLTSGGNADISRDLWNMADRRLVISHQMGVEYQNLFGSKNFEVITDGVSTLEIAKPKPINVNELIVIYFAGLLHIDYLELFKTLADALDEISITFKFKLILRGTQNVDFLNNRNFIVEYLPVTLDSVELKKELDEADILYLPIKFTIPEFYKFSLSTKMIGYLGASGCILYHGPSDSAACQLLEGDDAAIICSSLLKIDMLKSLNDLIANNNTKSNNAKLLVQKNFLLEDVQKKFWQ